ncbi:MAG: MarR family transcriptional regulator [Variovorax sp.]|nr:MarR family transcriptional regulator [Variovorax sp.]
MRAPGLGFVVSKLSRRIVWSLAKMTSAHGVLPAQFPVLRTLNTRKASTQMELSRLCGIEQPSMAVTLNRMENAGLIDRRADESDGRRKIVTLTAHGQKMLQLMTASAHAVYEQATQNLSDEEIAVFLELCERMTANLEREKSE